MTAELGFFCSANFQESPCQIEPLSFPKKPLGLYVLPASSTPKFQEMVFLSYKERLPVKEYDLYIPLFYNEARKSKKKNLFVCESSYLGLSVD